MAETDCVSKMSLEGFNNSVHAEFLVYFWEICHLQSASFESPDNRLVNLDVEDCSKELLRQQSYAIKSQQSMEANSPYSIRNQRGASKISPNEWGYFAFQSP